MGFVNRIKYNAEKIGGNVIDFSHWRSVDDAALQQLPYHIAEWLAEFGSLTEKLSRYVDKVKLEVLHESLQLAHPHENGILSLAEKEKSHIREVILYGPTKPWIFARTIVPEQTGYLIQSLGDKPLGSILFSGKQLSRQFLHFKKLGTDDRLFKAAKKHFSGNDDYLWARRSLWTNKHHKTGSDVELSMLVCEVFLPDAPLYKK